MAKFNSPFRYPGGKSILSKTISKLLKDNNLYDSTYIEPYAGGAGAALNLLYTESVSEIVINDLDRAIYSAWYSILNHTEDFVKKIENTPITVDERIKQKDIYSNKNSSILDLGFATFFLNRTNRSGILNAGVIGGNQQLGKWKIDARFNKEKLIERIEKVSLYKDRIKLFNLDGIDLLKKYRKENNFFIYLDPPYVNKGSVLYMNSFNIQDHKELANYIKENLSEKYWLVSYDNTRIIKELYNDFRIKEFSISYSAAKFQKGKEVFIFSDQINNPFLYERNQ